MYNAFFWYVILISKILPSSDRCSFSIVISIPFLNSMDTPLECGESEKLCTILPFHRELYTNSLDLMKCVSCRYITSYSASRNQSNSTILFSYEFNPLTLRDIHFKSVLI